MDNNNPLNDPLDKHLSSGFKINGIFFPRTDEEVLYYESMLKDSALPPHLISPPDLFLDYDNLEKTGLLTANKRELIKGAEFQRAARFGKDIPPLIEEKMHQDRNAAKKRKRLANENETPE